MEETPRARSAMTMGRTIGVLINQCQVLDKELQLLKYSAKKISQDKVLDKELQLLQQVAYEVQKEVEQHRLYKKRTNNIPTGYKNSKRPRVMSL